MDRPIKFSLQPPSRYVPHFEPGSTQSPAETGVSKPQEVVHNFKNTDLPATMETYDALQAVFLDIFRHRREDPDPQTLPHKYPLKKRFADHRYKEINLQSRFTHGVYCIDRLKDIPLALVMKLYTDCVVIDGEQHSTQDYMVQEWLDWVDLGKLHPELVELLHEHNMTVYYDGYVVIELQDFRGIKFHQSFKLEGSIYTTKHSSEPNPEIHRIILKPNDASIDTDIKLMLDDVHGKLQWNDEEYLDMDQTIRNCLFSPLCLDPSIQNTKLLNLFNFQSAKYKSFRGQLGNPTKDQEVQLDSPSTESEKQSETLDSFGFKLLTTIRNIQGSKNALKQDPMFGLDKRTGGALSRKTLWNIPLQRIYRTVRMERDGTDSRSTVLMNIVAANDGIPEVVLKIEQASNTIVNRFRLHRIHTIEPYVQSFKALITIQDYRMKCVTDLTNPSAWALFAKPH